MFQFLKNLFSPKPQVDTDEYIRELWETEFDSIEKGRFPVVEDSGYRAFYDHDRYCIELQKSDFFAWVLDPVYQYDDFVLETDLTFGTETGHFAAGFAFRAVNEENFHYLLVSNRGYWRFDTVFNGAPRTIVAWTEILHRRTGSVVRLKLIARGNRFTVVINDEWSGEVEDETFKSGRIGFAAQNYHETDCALASFLSLEVESRQIEVETAWYQWNGVIPVNPDARAALAETWFASRDWLKAAVELKKTARIRRPSSRETFLLAECYLNLNLIKEALETLESLLLAEPGNIDAAKEKANVLYLCGRYLDLRDWIAAHETAFEGDALMHNLKGHAGFNLGDYAEAARSYDEAAALNPGIGLYVLNAARAYDHFDSETASGRFLAAARLFFDAEDFASIDSVLPRLKDGLPGDPFVRSLEAKLAYRHGDYGTAGLIFSELIAQGTDDSAIFYLQGLMAAMNGDRKSARPLFERACALSPDFAAYRFRLAESRFLAGENPGDDIRMALELDPESGWTHNLAGQIALAGNDPVQAAFHLEKAMALLPDQADPVINLSELLFETGKLEESIEVLDGFIARGNDSARTRNQKGNILARSGDVDGAVAEYEHAARTEPDDREIRLNLAAAYIQAERFSMAEDELARILDSGTDARACLLAGNLAEIMGDRVRAETAFRLGLESEPFNKDLLASLAINYLNRLKPEKARTVIDTLLPLDPERGADLERRYLDATTDTISCASCGREWRSPRPLPPQRGFTVFAEPPDGSPAGSCPRCGKSYCVACRKAHLENDRFTCPDCRIPLKLSDDRIKYLVRAALGDSGSS